VEQPNSVNYSKQVIHGTYYPHIDGIRALAVLPVLLFHVLDRLCPGGFAGVDVFFVISGYLITGGILRDSEAKRFTIRNFYYRRIRRIMPAYVVLIAGVFAAGCAIYYSLPLIHLGDASVMGTLFSANLYFWKLTGDYFAPDARTNPLLHLWSLSVEEQFYLFIPLLCATMWRFRRRWLVPMLGMIATLSFAGATYAVAKGHSNSAFYLLHYRAWELLAGSLLATLPTKASPQAGSSTSSTALAAAGLLMVLLPYAFLSERIPFPGVTALPSVLGTTLLIRYGQSGWVNRLLSWVPSVGAGKISYSLYLWHWPVTVFWRYAVYDQLYAYDYVGMVVLSLLLGYLSWRLIEMPARTSPFWTMQRCFAFAAAGVVLLVAVGTSCVFSKGWPTVLHPQANRLKNETPRFVEGLVRNKARQVLGLLGYHVPYDDFVPFSLGGGGDFHLGNPSVAPELFLLGDSHAGVLQYGLDRVLLEQNRSGYAITRSATEMFDLGNPESRRAVDELATHPSASKVVLSQFWTYKEYDKSVMFERLREFIALIQSMGKQVFVLDDVPIYEKAPGDVLARMTVIRPRAGNLDYNEDRLWQSDGEYERAQGDIVRALRAACREAGAVLVPLDTLVKRGDRYISFDSENGQPVPLYNDRHHLSPAGSLRAARFLLPYLFPPADVPHGVSGSDHSDVTGTVP
jgi:peptidoglycan/LPS O-acetylase OafA/YrhL